MSDMLSTVQKNRHFRLSLLLFVSSKIVHYGTNNFTYE